MAIAHILCDRRIVSALIWLGILFGVLTKIFQGDFTSGTDARSVEVIPFFFLFIFPVVPYLICFLVLRKVTNPVLVLPAVVFLIGMDVLTYIEAFITPTSSTAGLGLIMAPFVSLILLLPIGFFLGWLLTRFGPFKTESTKMGETQI